jgi:predicted nucleic acid-binding protein
MSFLLDTDICSASMKGLPAVSNRFVQYSGRLHMSTVTLGELFAWASRKSLSHAAPIAVGLAEGGPSSSRG